MMKTSIRSLADLGVVTLSVAAVMALLATGVLRQRSLARIDDCRNHLRQLGLGIHNYHAAYNQMPPTCGGTTGNEDPAACNQGRLGFLVALSPFIEQQALWEKISNPYISPTASESFPPMGPVPWFDAEVYLPWGQSPGTFRCPDDTDENHDENAYQPRIVFTLQPIASMGLTTNYVACFGDSALQAGLIINKENKEEVAFSAASHRGLFVAGRVSKFRDCLDGLANTVMMSETVASIEGGRGPSGIVQTVDGLSMNPSLCLSAGNDPASRWHDFGRGSRWCDGALLITGFQTVLPPNSTSCTSELGVFDAIASTSSRHAGGVNVLMADGAIAFVSDSVDTGDLTAPAVANQPGYTAPGSQSPYGLWGGMGTRASMEPIANDLRNEKSGIEFPVWNRNQAAFANDGAGEIAFPLEHWTDQQGEVSLRARFMRIIDSKIVELRDDNGVLHQVPLNTLSDRHIFRAVEMDLMRKVD